ncbi:MAG: hypothetical protein QM809_10720 [Gordonia sp. (in: high G+C Gram-positive bacteria)]|uniref:hypothetical protein n=1 Tax=Gordonia sp. (in: high G+C Gram-positive bacteria) TaxID=84139 RepID=UPI0039E60C3B
MDDDHDDFVGCDTWDEMTAWLGESLPDIPAGVTIDFGPKDLHIGDEPLDDEFDDTDPIEALCAQIVVLKHGRYLVRRSHVVMEATNYLDHDASSATPNLWFDDDPTGDCTAGSIYVDDAGLAAEICVTWLRAESGLPDPTEFGFDISEATHLPGLPGTDAGWSLDDFLRRLGH